MNTALEKLNSAITDDVSGGRHMISFTFAYGGYEFEYMGRYYAYVHPIDDSRSRSSVEYCWGSYDEMLAALISQTGMSVSDMLSNLPDHDLELDLDIPLPPGAMLNDP